MRLLIPDLLFLLFVLRLLLKPVLYTVVAATAWWPPPSKRISPPLGLTWFPMNLSPEQHRFCFVETHFWEENVAWNGVVLEVMQVFWRGVINDVVFGVVECLLEHCRRWGRRARTSLVAWNSRQGVSRGGSRSRRWSGSCSGRWQKEKKNYLMWSLLWYFCWESHIRWLTNMISVYIAR